MKKKLFLLAVLVCSALSSATAAIDEALRSLITTSADVTITEVSNDAAYPFSVADGVATSTNGKISSKTEAVITIKFQGGGRFVISHNFTFDSYPGVDYRRIYLDGICLVDNYNNQTTVTASNIYRQLADGEHELKFTMYHSGSTTSSYTQILTLRDISIKTVESMYKTITLSAAGTLGTEALAQVNTLPDMEYLRLNGPMNSADWTAINNMTGLKAIDMSGATITEIPASAFANTSLRFITFPSTVTSIGKNAFYNRYLTGTLTLPESLVSIGEKAFYCNNISDVTIPNSVTTMGSYAFYDNDSLTTVTLSSGCATIPSSCFDDCKNLKTVYNCGSVTTVDNSAFYGCDVLETLAGMKPVTVNASAFRNCYQLRSFDFSDVTTIGGSAFSSCRSLQTADLASATSLASNCFDGCSALTTVKTNDRLTVIPDYAFQSCANLQTVVLGASVRQLGYNCFYSSSAPLSKVYVNAPAPPSVASTIPFYTTSGITLYVPEYAITTYKLHDYWSKFTSVETNPNPVSDVNLYSKLELTTNARIPDTPNMTLGYANEVGGALVINGDLAQPFNHYKQYLRNADYCPSLISRCNSLTSNSSAIVPYFNSGYWYYLCMPFDVLRSDITCTNSASIAVRYFDSANRAINGSGSNWKDVGEDEILKAGQGYIFRVSTACEATLPATAGTHNNIFAATALTTPLTDYASAVSNDADWNLVGNPYPAFFDIYYMDYTAPITVWNVDNSTYTAYSVADDNLVLKPCQAFFVQKPDGISGITFNTDGRQTNTVIDHSTAAKPSRLASSDRRLIELTLGNGTVFDRTRVVVNPDATDEFCADNDACKMMANSLTPQIYTIGGTDIYAINEGSHQSGKVNVGIVLPSDGTYTIDFMRNDAGAVLLDNGMAVEMPYTFTASEGVSESRFVLSLGNIVNRISGTATADNADNTVYTIGGIRTTDASAKGIYIKNNKKIVK